MGTRLKRRGFRLDGLLREICHAYLIITSRLHRVTLAHLNATPVLALSYDLEVDAYMKAIGQMDYCLNINHLTPDMLIGRFCALKAFRQKEQAHLRSEALRFRRLLDLQYERILGPAQDLQPNDLPGNLLQTPQRRSARTHDVVS